MKFEELHPRDQLVAVMNRIYHNGMTTLTGGNLSILEENGDIWVTPSAIDKGKLRPEDMICMKKDGNVIGLHKPSIELPFHQAIYKRRPDLRAVLHAHPPALVTFSISHQIPNTRIIPQADRVCRPIGFAPYALPGSMELGENIAATFAQGFNSVILENHGMAAAGDCLLDAYHRLETLDFCARTLIRAAALGRVNTLTDEQLALFDNRTPDLQEFLHESISDEEQKKRRLLVEIVHRACKRYLMISTEGVASVRLEGDDFLITPTGLDRHLLEEDDVVLVRDGKRENGKHPSRSVLVHAEIYKKHPEIQSIISAQSPNIVAYAITESEFESKLIPESYLVLLDVPKVPFEVIYNQPHRLAEIVSLKTPVVIVENDCVLVVGDSLINAFDRMEIAEFSAMALHDTLFVGNLVTIGRNDVQDLEHKFFGTPN